MSQEKIQNARREDCLYFVGSRFREVTCNSEYPLKPFPVRDTKCTRNCKKYIPTVKREDLE